MDVIKILEDRINQRINSEKTNQINALSGSNGLLYDGYNFEAESSDNCPRFALLRRVGGIQEDKSIKSFISNQHGRTFEALLNDILSTKLDEENLEFQEEEEVEVKLEDSQGNVLLTARPDKIIKYKNELFPIEVKTIQSNTTAYSVFIKESPKLGALIQIAIYLIGHKLTKGFILYCASNWFGGFAGKTKWKVEPSFKIFSIELKDGDIYCNNIKTIISYDKIIQGSYEFLNLKQNNNLPRRPVWLNYEGKGSIYSGCTYCFANTVCDEADIESFNLIKFFKKFKEKNENFV